MLCNPYPQDRSQALSWCLISCKIRFILLGATGALVKTHFFDFICRFFKIFFIVIPFYTCKLYVYFTKEVKNLLIRSGRGESKAKYNVNRKLQLPILFNNLRGETRKMSTSKVKWHDQPGWLGFQHRSTSFQATERRQRRSWRMIEESKFGAILIFQGKTHVEF